jgi:F0F1-type ATP synthase membrane subunit a
MGQTVQINTWHTTYLSDTANKDKEVLMYLLMCATCIVHILHKLYDMNIPESRLQDFMEAVSEQMTVLHQEHVMQIHPLL